MQLIFRISACACLFFSLGMLVFKTIEYKYKQKPIWTQPWPLTSDWFKWFQPKTQGEKVQIINEYRSKLLNCNILSSVSTLVSFVAFKLYQTNNQYIATKGYHYSDLIQLEKSWKTQFKISLIIATAGWALDSTLSKIQYYYIAQSKKDQSNP